MIEGAEMTSQKKFTLFRTDESTCVMAPKAREGVG